MTQEADVKEAIDKTVQKFGALHVAIACAGVGWAELTITKRQKSFDAATFWKVMKVNLFGSVNMAKYAAVAMARNQGDDKGLILFTSSVAAEEG